MRYLILALALVFGMGNFSNDAVQALVDEGKDAQAFALANEGAAQGEARAHEWLGWLYDNGRGVDQDFAKAALHYRLAIESGGNYARWRVGVMIDDGDTPGTLEEAVALFDAAASEGFTNAMVSLAVMQATGRGTEQDFALAFANYMNAAHAGNPHGVQGVGVMYDLGQGVEEDDSEALAWFVVAAALGNETANGYVARMAEGRSASEMVAAATRANEIALELGHDLDIAFTPNTGAQ